MSQCSDIIAHIQIHGSITPLDANRLYGCLALHSRISELRERGHDIICTLIDTPSGKVVGSYSIDQPSTVTPASSTPRSLPDESRAVTAPHEQLITAHYEKMVNGKKVYLIYQYTAVGFAGDQS